MYLGMYGIFSKLMGLSQYPPSLPSSLSPSPHLSLTPSPSPHLSLTPLLISNGIVYAASHGTVWQSIEFHDITVHSNYSTS